jgi:hypothetical protein
MDDRAGATGQRKAAFSDQNDSSFGEKPEFSSDFQRPNLTMRDIMGLKTFHRH